MTERADSLRNDIREQVQLTEMAKRRRVRSSTQASSSEGSQGGGTKGRAASLECPSVELGESARSGNDSSAGVEEPSTLVQRRCAPRTRPQD